MSTVAQEIAYPSEYGAEVEEGGDIRLRFMVAGSRLGPVEIVLVADDAESLADELYKAAQESAAMLEAELNDG